MDTRYLTMQEVADLLRVDIATVKRYVANRTVPSIQLGGRRTAVRIPASALDDMLRTRAS